MLAKSKTSGLILAFVFFASYASAYLAIYPIRSFAGIPVWVGGLLVLLNALVIYGVSRSGIVMGLEENVGFGLRGLAGWLVVGALSGLLISVTNNYLLSRLEKSVLYPILQITTNSTIIYVAYWVAFRRNLFKMIDVKGPNILRNRRFESTFFIISGLLVTLTALFWAFDLARRNETGGFWFAAGVTCMGLSALLLGSLNRERYRDGFTNRLLWVELGLFGIGLVFLAVGFLAVL